MRADADHVKLAHHGFVTADCDTDVVTRIQIETEPASVRRRGQELAIGMRLDLRYGPTMIASKEFLLPLQAIEIAPYGKTLTKMEIQFQQYRKYEASSNVVFDDQAVKSSKPPDQ